MQKFIPREKMSRKARRQLDGQRRAVWAISPVTRKIPDKKAYSRSRQKLRARDGAEFCFCPANSAEISPKISGTSWSS